MTRPRESLFGHALAKREIEVLEGAMLGETVPKTAARLYLAKKTVETYRRRCLLKLGALNITNAVALYLREEMRRRESAAVMY